MYPSFSIVFIVASLNCFTAPKPAASIPKNDTIISARIVDGLGNPIPGVTVELKSDSAKAAETTGIRHTDKEGRFTFAMANELKMFDLGLQKDGYVYCSMPSPLPASAVITMRHTIDWEKLSVLPYCHGEELDRGMRDLLASAEGSDKKQEGFVVDDSKEGSLLRFLFKYQADLLPAIRRLGSDPHVGGESKRWLDKLGDPKDRELVPEGRKFAPQHEIGEEDLVQSIKAISAKLNWFSDAPEPKIEVTSITFTPKMDRALVECGINLAPMTGVFWEFVFHKEGKRWVLRSMQEVGRG